LGRSLPPDATQAVGVQRARPPAGVMVPGTYQSYAPPPPPPTRSGRRKVVRDVRSRHVVRRVDVWSVFKVSMVVYVCVLGVFLVAGTVLWNVAVHFGVITSVDKLVRSLFALGAFQLHPMTALAWTAAIAGALCFIGVLLNVLASVLYNLISDIIGGIQVTLVNDQDD
jgi:Transmembrane domain of unknown function (DUF3566)